VSEETEKKPSIPKKQCMKWTERKIKTAVRRLEEQSRKNCADPHGLHKQRKKRNKAVQMYEQKIHGRHMGQYTH
jgi:hypothetical protein